VKLLAPNQAPRIVLDDAAGKPVEIGAPGRRTLLCFFRDTRCPFCNFRVYELTHRFEQFRKFNLDVIALFAATPEDVRQFVAQRPRPFPVIADGNGDAYQRYGVDRVSFWGKLKGIVMRLPTALRGIGMVGLIPALRSNNLMPADFLIDETGKIVETWYGSDAGDRIPMERIELFAARGLLS